MKGIIYKIECCITGEVYYGSTICSLKERIGRHISKCRYWKEGKSYSTKCTSFQIIERENYTFSVVETVDFENKKELLEREGHYIKNHSCVNRAVMGRTPKEYRNDNAEKRLQWVNENKAHLIDYKSSWYESNKDRILEKRRIHYEQNKEIINERRRKHSAK